MKKYLHQTVLVFAIISLLLMAVWLTKSCEHDPIVTTNWKIDSLAYYKNLAKTDSVNSAQSYEKYEADNTHYNNPDSAGRERLRAILWERVRINDSLSRAATR